MGHDRQPLPGREVREDFEHLPSGQEQNFTYSLPREYHISVQTLQEAKNQSKRKTLRKGREEWKVDWAHMAKVMKKPMYVLMEGML